MANLCARPLAGIALLSILSVLPAGWARSDSRPELLVVYFNEDSPRIRQALAKLESALRETGVAARHRIKLRHVVVDFKNPAQTEDAMRKALQERPAALITPNSLSATIAKAATREVPVVFGSHQEPIHAGLVDALAKPGGNLTGFTYYVPIDPKRLELLRQIAPRARRLGILGDRWWLGEAGDAKVTMRAAADQGFVPSLFSAATVSELKALLARPDAQAMDAWFVPYALLAIEEPQAVLDSFAALRKPIVFSATLFVERGGLASYQQKLTLEDSLRLLATTLGLVLDGVPPGEIPVERPKSFELAINLDAAQRLGLTVPLALVKRADRVIFTAR